MLDKPPNQTNKTKPKCNHVQKKKKGKRKKKKKSSGSFKNVINKMSLENIFYIYMYKKDLASTNLQWLICYISKPNHCMFISIYFVSLFLLRYLHTVI